MKRIERVEMAALWPVIFNNMRYRAKLTSQEIKLMVHRATA
jgi:hypothetical protein